MPLNATELACFGLADHHIMPRTQLPAGVRQPLHTDVIAPFLLLQVAARDAGFDLQVVSGFRGFDRQLAIWNKALSGAEMLSLKKVSNLKFHSAYSNLVESWEMGNTTGDANPTIIGIKSFANATMVNTPTIVTDAP